jgi:hypothetical protein
MMRHVSLAVVCLVLAVSGLAYADYLGPTSNGLEFHISVIPSEIYLPDPSHIAPAAEFPSSASLTVRVRDVERQPVDGVPVIFQASPACDGIVSVSPQRAVTHNGVAQASVQAQNTTGACWITVRVDHVSQEFSIAVSNTPSINVPLNVPR